MDGGWQLFLPKLHIDPDDSYPYVWSNAAGSNALLHKGKWFNVDAGQTIELNILIGDWGGQTGFFLYLEQQDAKYPKAPDGITPKLPLFQIGAKLPTPSGEETPPSSDSTIIWTPVY